MYVSLIFFLIIIIISIFKNVSLKKENIAFICFYVIIGILISILIFNSIPKKGYENTTSNEKADGFEITNFNVNLDVHEDNNVDVTEDIGIYFYEAGHHGIYRFIPEWYRYTGKDNKTISRKSTIKGLQEVHHNYTVDTVKKKKRIKIGSPYTTLPIGKVDYEIKYTYEMGSDPYDGFDEFIFHLYGDFWGTEIFNPSVTIKMPKEFDKDKVHFFMDKERKIDVTEAMDYSVYNNILTASLNYDKYDLLKKKHSDYPDGLDRSLTVDIELPEGYFLKGEYTYSNVSLYFVMAVFVITIIILLLWIFYGKDYEKEIKVVNYMPPRNMSSAEIGYIYSKTSNKKLTISLIVELAAKNYIKLKQKDKKSDVYIKGDPNEDLSHLNKYEKLVFKNLIDRDSEFVIKENTTFYKTFNELNSDLYKDLNFKINEKRSIIFKIISLLLTTLSVILMLISNSYYKYLELNKYIFYYSGIVLVIINLFLSIIMNRRTSEGEKLYAEVLGFKEFLETVEKDKLEELVEEMPNYFYNILPYTYIFNISNKWIKKFEKISMPDNKNLSVDVGRVFSDITSDISYPVSASSSSGCSSCGGGCSSCGGGCSSCGGGGSW